MTSQEVFDKVKNHLLAQNKRSCDEDLCLYRGPDGLKCAVGCWIPDDKYLREFEHLNSTASAVWKATGLNNDLRGLVRELQYIHDYYEPNQWPEKLRECYL